MCSCCVRNVLPTPQSGWLSQYPTSPLNIETTPPTLTLSLPTAIHHESTQSLPKYTIPCFGLFLQKELRTSWPCVGARLIMTPSFPSILIAGLTYLSLADAQGATDLVGTWSTKSNETLTGPGFFDPVKDRLIEPPRTGISYSFTLDGHYEEAYFRAISNRKSTV